MLQDTDLFFTIAAWTGLLGSVAVVVAVAALA